MGLHCYQFYFMKTNLKICRIFGLKLTMILLVEHTLLPLQKTELMKTKNIIT